MSTICPRHNQTDLTGLRLVCVRVENKAIFYALQSGLQTLGFDAVYLSSNCGKKSQENPYFLASHVTLVALFLSRAAQLFLPVSLS